ncbi:hypothetical protein SARC_03469 [Sphaeroforma arctica JP610]|uniref:Uncharacterized protein n=1 Tax=Sphaeroforma arctica JP610 TaxID=667725 RepID=A0A0L0G7U2_9EUKA|nr:hypothetical protein SARC_03469 [Sphaeroforma arctica JP610]KNC84308.1 hypothetical protein SARC_03469 [Sphaeroforma arctica JP610]|eukprot:XP_014158210.1 hypothetical protein SARC_03469 [Sphaeroforma arctica JP610]
MEGQQGRQHRRSHVEEKWRGGPWIVGAVHTWAYADSGCTFNLVSIRMIQKIGVTARDRHEGPPLEGIDGMGALAPELSVPWDDLEAYLVILGVSYALAEGHPFYVVEDIPMGCDILIGYDQMRHSK